MKHSSTVSALALGSFCLLAASVAGCSSVDAERSSTVTAGALDSVVTIAHGADGIAAFKVRYWATSASDPSGSPAMASGLLLVPDGAKSDALTSYQHSSAVARSDVPSVPGTPHWDAAVRLARSGRIVVAADYLGLGDSEGAHPWLDATTEASVTRELLDAVPIALGRLALRVPSKLDLVGFSQGAHATMALARSLTDRPTSFTLRSIIGIAGPYALADVDVPALVDGTSDPAVRSLALARLVHASEIRGANVASMYAPGRRDEVHALFDGTHTDVEVATTLPADPSAIFSERGWLELREPASAFGHWLETTSLVCDGWTPRAEVVLMHASGDTSALPANSTLCRLGLEAAKATVRFEDLGNVDHIPSGEEGILRAALILSQLDSR